MEIRNLYFWLASISKIGSRAYKKYVKAGFYLAFFEELFIVILQ